MSDERPPLVLRMHALADDGHVDAEKLRRAADAIEDAEGMKALVGAWARARKVVAAATGEPLL